MVSWRFLGAWSLILGSAAGFVSVLGSGRVLGSGTATAGVLVTDVFFCDATNSRCLWGLIADIAFLVQASIALSNPSNKGFEK